MKTTLLPFFLFLSFILPNPLLSQDLLSGLEEEEPVKHVTASFKNSRVINSQSLETTSHGVLDFRISHRFETINSGFYNMFGLDNALMRIGFDYGITSRLQAGVGRSNWMKTYDGYLKYRLLWQTEGTNKMPLSVVLVANASLYTLKNPMWSFNDKLGYVGQMIIGRKFNDRLSLQLMPTYVRRNYTDVASEKKDVFAFGIAGRYKVSKRLAVNAEYYFVPPGQLASDKYNSLSLGVDIETGGHVFQLQVTNSRAMFDRGFITETTGDWLKGDIHFGFNISRVFTLHNPKPPKN